MLRVVNHDVSLARLDVLVERTLEVVKEGYPHIKPMGVTVKIRVNKGTAVLHR